jgi:hypothetical protein
MDAHDTFVTRGVVLMADDLSLGDWPERAARAGLTTIALHSTSNPETSMATVAAFVQSDAGRSFLARCRELGVEVEYELHCMRELLPRDFFATEPGMFRMDEAGNRTPDANLCVHSREALDAVEKNAVAIARILRPTTGRYFLWGDDGKPWCRCPECREFSDSEQALLLENRLLGVLRRADPEATLAHLSYSLTLPPPRKVRPAAGIFLEFAPISRRFDTPITDGGARARSGAPSHAELLGALDANLHVFGPESAQVLEYWLDVSLFAHHTRDQIVALPWNREVVAEDLRAYAQRGIRSITSFAAWMDASYVRRFGEPPLDEYGALLRQAIG